MVSPVQLWKHVQKDCEQSKNKKQPVPRYWLQAEMCSSNGGEGEIRTHGTLVHTRSRRAP